MKGKVCFVTFQTQAIFKSIAQIKAFYEEDTPKRNPVLVSSMNKDPVIFNILKIPF